MQYLWERRTGTSKVEDLPTSGPAPIQATSSPVRNGPPAASPTSSTTSSSPSTSHGSRRTPPQRPSRRDQPSLFEDEENQSVFEWDSEEDDAYDRRVAKVRLWNKMSIRRSDCLDQPTGSRHSSAERVESVRSCRADASRDRVASDPSPKTHLSRMSSMSLNLKRSSSSASRLAQLRSPRASVLGCDLSPPSPSPMAGDNTRGGKYKSSFSDRISQSPVQYRPVGNYF